jgi:hypothetical protein
MYVLIIAGSLPTLRPVWKFVRIRLGMTSYSSRTGESYGMDHPSSKAGRVHSSKPGPITLAFEEIGNEEAGLRSNGGSSMEDILPKDTGRRNTTSDQKMQVQVTKEFKITNSTEVDEPADAASRPFPYSGPFQ